MIISFMIIQKKSSIFSSSFTLLSILFNTWWKLVMNDKFNVFIAFCFFSEGNSGYNYLCWSTLPIFQGLRLLQLSFVFEERFTRNLVRLKKTLKVDTSYNFLAVNNSRLVHKVFVDKIHNVHIMINAQLRWICLICINNLISQFTSVYLSKLFAYWIIHFFQQIIIIYVFFIIFVQLFILIHQRFLFMF